MTPVDQLVIDDYRGDCLRASIASILDLPAEAVPNFCDREDWDTAFNEFIDSQGKRLLEICFPDPASLAKTYIDAHGEHVILTGTSPRKRLDGGKKAHAVVAVVKGWGVKIVHDPHPSRAGLADEGPRWVLFILNQ